MRGLVIHTESSLGWGGQEIRIFRELLGLQKMGYKTALIAPRQGQLYKRSKEAGVDVYHVPMASKLNILSWLRIFLILKKIRPIVVNTHSSEDSWLAGSAARIVGKILVIRTRHVSTPIGSMFSYRYFPHLILTTSDTITKNFIEMGIAVDDVVTLPTGVDFSQYAFSSKARKSIRDHLGCDDNTVLVGNTCVLRSWKGLDFFIETAALLPDSYRFLLVGDGPQRDHLVAKANSLGLAERIHFVGHQERVEEYFSAMDILFYTSYASEGVPQSLLQGIGAGLPAMAVKYSSIEETLRGLDNIFWVEYGQADIAADIIQKNMMPVVGGNRSSLPQLWVDNHSLSRMLEKIDALYQKRIGDQPH